MSDRFKEIDIKYRTYYFSDDMMHIKNLVLNKIKIKSQKKKKKKKNNIKIKQKKKKKKKNSY